MDQIAKTEPSCLSLYWINLDRSVDRYSHMHCSVINDPTFASMPKTRVSALDATKENLEDIVNLRKFFTLSKKTMSPAEYGCLGSHLEAIRQFSLSNSKYALIFEDDVCLDFKPYWKKTISEIIDNAPSNWEILQLCYIIKQYKPTTDYDLHTLQKDMWSTAAYIISKPAADQMMKRIYKGGKFCLQDNTHHQADRFLYQNCRTYTYKNCPFIYRTHNDSTIYPDFVYYHENSKNIVEAMLKNGGSWNNHWTNDGLANDGLAIDGLLNKIYKYLSKLKRIFTYNNIKDIILENQLNVCIILLGCIIIFYNSIVVDDLIVSDPV
jgi:GR25 family glycosyltransferase involved in LPS biosynthesis